MLLPGPVDDILIAALLENVGESGSWGRPKINFHVEVFLSKHGQEVGDWDMLARITLWGYWETWGYYRSIGYSERTGKSRDTIYQGLKNPGNIARVFIQNTILPYLLMWGDRGSEMIVDCLYITKDEKPRRNFRECYRKVGKFRGEIIRINCESVGDYEILR